jgi:hypothetical protein
MGIVERLRSDGEDERQRFREARATLGPLLADAAAEIERLSEANTQVWADNERLRAALREIHHARYTGRNTINPDSSYEHAIALNEKFIAVMDIARAALAEERA